MSDGYPFIFQMIDKSESDEYLIQTLQYWFKSDKSHHAYIVRVECYKKHAYCVKFFDKAIKISLVFVPILSRLERYSIQCFI